MQQVMQRLVASAVLVAVAAGAARADDALEVGHGETGLVVAASGTTTLAVTPIPDGILAVYNFTSAPCRLVPKDAGAPLVVPSGYEPVSADLGADVSKSFTVELEAEAGGELWVYVVADEVELEATGSRAMHVSRARYLQRRAEDLDASGRSDEALEALVWAGTELHHAFRLGEALELLEHVVERAAGTPREVDALVASSNLALSLGRRAEALEAARAALDLLAGVDAAGAALHRHSARLVAARTEPDARAAYGFARAALEDLPDVAGQLADGGLEAFVLCAETLRRAGHGEAADALAQRAWELARSVDARVARSIYGEAFDRRRDLYAERDGAAAALDRLEALAHTPLHRVHDAWRRARVATSPREATECFAAARELARDVLAEEQRATLDVAYGRSLAREGFIEAGREAVDEACRRIDPSWHPESRYACVRAAGQVRTELLVTLVADAGSLSWTREHMAAREALMAARGIGDEHGVPEWVDEVDYFIAFLDALVPGAEAAARERAESALASGRARGDRELVAAASILVGRLASDPVDGLAHARAAIGAARERQATDTEIHARAVAARWLLRQGDMAGFEEQRDAAQAVAAASLEDVAASSPDAVSRRLARSGLEAWASVDQDWVAARLAADPGDRAAVDVGLVSADFWSRAGRLDVAPPAALADVTSRVAADTVVLRYAAGGEDLYAYVVTDGGVEHRVVGDLGALIRRAGAFVRSIADRERLGDAARIVELGHPLWRELVADVAAHALVGRERLVVVPTPSLACLPFEALVVQPGDAPRRFADVDFALRRHPIRYASSLTDVFDAAPRRALGSMFVAADPIAADATSLVRGRTLRALPGSRDEALAIAEIFGEGVELCLGDEARLDAIAAAIGAHDIVHLAVHGLVGDGSDAAGLVFADGFLSLDDIRGFELGAALVVLSACETASGRLRVSQRVDSLANAFQAAGAGGVVGTLWPVQDVSTAALMRRFYDALVARGVPAPEALDEARLAVLDASIEDLVGDLAQGDAERGRRLRDRVRDDVPDGHPYLWAPFVYLGRPVTLDR